MVHFTLCRWMQMEARASMEMLEQRWVLGIVTLNARTTSSSSTVRPTMRIGNQAKLMPTQELESTEVVAQKLTFGKRTRSAQLTQCMRVLQESKPVALAPSAATMARIDSKECVTRMVATFNHIVSATQISG